MATKPKTPKSRAKNEKSGTLKKETPALRLEWRSPAELADNPANWRAHPESQIAALTDVIAEVGWAGALLYNERTGRLIDGHARRKVATAQGAAKVPVLVGSWDEATERKILATLDPIAAMASADAAALDALLRGIDTGSEALQAMLAELANDAGLYGAGAGTGEYTGVAPEVVEDEAPEPPRVPITRPGDLWILGPHRLLCGDSTKAEDVGRLMGGERAALCFTSPPYNVGRLGWSDKSKYDTDADDKSSGDFREFLDTSTRLSLGVADWLVLNIQQVSGNKVAFVEWLHEWREHFADMAIWNKETAEPAMEPGVLNSQFEYLVVLSARKNPTRKLPATWRGSVSNVHSGGKRAGNDAASIHRATFPLHVPEWGMRAFDEAKLIYEPFSGSGTTLIAAHQLNRRCFAIEIAPAYVDVACQRFFNLTGTRPVREGDGFEWPGIGEAEEDSEE